MKEWPKKVATALRMKDGRIIRSRYDTLLNEDDNGSLPSHLELAERRGIRFEDIWETGFMVGRVFTDGGGGSLIEG